MTATVTHEETGVAVPSALVGSPTIDGDTVLQVISGAALTPNQTYRVAVAATVSAGSNVETALTQMRCVA